MHISIYIYIHIYVCTYLYIHSYHIPISVTAKRNGTRIYNGSLHSLRTPQNPLRTPSEPPQNPLRIQVGSKTRGKLRILITPSSTPYHDRRKPPPRVCTVHTYWNCLYTLCITNSPGACTWEKSISDSFEIERNMIVVTVFFLTMIQMEIRSVHNKKENCPYDHVPFNSKGN